MHPPALPLVGAPVLGRCATVRDFLAHRRSKGHPAAAPHPRRRVRGEEARAAGRLGAVPPLLSLGAAVRLGVQFDVGTALREGRKGAAGGVESHQGGSIAMPGPALAVATCVCGFRPWSPDNSFRPSFRLFQVNVPVCLSPNVGRQTPHPRRARTPHGPQCGVPRTPQSTEVRAHTTRERVEREREREECRCARAAAFDGGGLRTALSG